MTEPISMILVKKATYFAKNHRIKGVTTIIFDPLTERINFFDKRGKFLAFVGYRQGKGKGNDDFWIG